MVKRTIDIAWSIMTTVFFFPALLLCALCLTSAHNVQVPHEDGPGKWRVRRPGRAQRPAGHTDRQAVACIAYGRITSALECFDWSNVADCTATSCLGYDNQFEKVLGDYVFRHHVKPGILDLFRLIRFMTWPSPASFTVIKRSASVD